MITLSPDEVALIRWRSLPKESLLTALRAIKVRDIDKALMILSKHGGEACAKSTHRNP